MANLDGRLDHLTISNRAQNRDFHRPGGGGGKIRPVDRGEHGLKLRGDLASALAAAETERGLTIEELKALGVILTLEAASAAFPLKLETLDQYSTHRERRP